MRSEHSLSLCEYQENASPFLYSDKGLQCLSSPSQGLREEDSILLFVFIVNPKVGESSDEKASGVLSKHTKQ